MANWEKKIRWGGGKDLLPDEELVGGMLVNPYGMTGKMMLKEIGGVVGSALADKGRTPSEGLVTDEGIAAEFPEDRIWIALTTKRLLVWGHSTMSGKPKGLKLTLEASDLEAVELTKLKTAHAVVLRFRDGTGRVYEAPKLFNDPEGFAAAVASLRP